MNQIHESSQVDGLAALGRSIGIGVIAVEDLAYVLQRMHHAALPSAVGTKEQGDGAQVDADFVREAFEIL